MNDLSDTYRLHVAAFCYVLPASETGWMKIATLMSALYTTTTWNT